MKTISGRRVARRMVKVGLNIFVAQWCNSNLQQPELFKQPETKWAKIVQTQ